MCVNEHLRGCVTPKVIENLKVSIEDNMDLFDGYDELPGEAQEKMRRVLEQGHVDDDDWRGVCNAHQQTLENPQALILTGHRIESPRKQRIPQAHAKEES